MTSADVHLNTVCFGGTSGPERLGVGWGRRRRRRRGSEGLAAGGQLPLSCLVREPLTLRRLRAGTRALQRSAAAAVAVCTAGNSCLFFIILSAFIAFQMNMYKQNAMCTKNADSLVMYM